MTTNSNKINVTQKALLAEYMEEHPNLAKNKLPNCGQGKATCLKLWEEFARKLNAEGPPIKDAKLWRKVYFDQKYQAKKKLSFNKYSRTKTGGGPYEEKFISEVEEQLIAASGLEASVDGMNVKAFGSSESPDILNRNTSRPVPDCNDSVIEMVFVEDNDNSDDDIHSNQEQIREKIVKVTAACNNNTRPTKLALIEEGVKNGIEFQKEINSKLDRLLSIQERTLQIREEKFNIYMRTSKLDLEIKTVQLEIQNLKRSKLL